VVDAVRHFDAQRPCHTRSLARRCLAVKGNADPKTYPLIFGAHVFPCRARHRMLSRAPSPYSRGKMGLDSPRFGVTIMEGGARGLRGEMVMRRQ
jgi:hypothetical protein